MTHLYVTVKQIVHHRFKPIKVTVCHRYPDTYVRNKAVDQLKQLPPDDLYELLPQLVQVCPWFCSPISDQFSSDFENVQLVQVSPWFCTPILDFFTSDRKNRGEK